MSQQGYEDFSPYTASSDIYDKLSLEKASRGAVQFAAGDLITPSLCPRRIVKQAFPNQICLPQFGWESF